MRTLQVQAKQEVHRQLRGAPREIEGLLEAPRQGQSFFSFLCCLIWESEHPQSHRVVTETAQPRVLTECSSEPSMLSGIVVYQAFLIAGVRRSKFTHVELAIAQDGIRACQESVIICTRRHRERLFCMPPRDQMVAF